MGKEMIKASRWTCRSLFSLYSKAVAFIFAVFCVVSGLSAGTVSAKDGNNGKTISGKALWSADSTTLKKVKIFIGSDIVCPVYGVGFSCSFNVVDSMITDSMGNFKTGYPESLFNQGNGWVTFAQVDPNSGNNRIPVAVTNGYHLNSNSDTIVTIYLHPVDFSGISQKTASVPASLIKTIHGSNVSIKIGNWSAGSKYSAQIMDVAGRLIASPSISSEGILTWNSEKYSRGVYFINVETDHGMLNTKIAVK